MKIALAAFGFVVVLMAVMIFGAVALAAFVRWQKWPNDALVAMAIAFVLLAGISMAAWRLGMK
jgi:Flp pilus assembly protein CpaB